MPDSGLVVAFGRSRWAIPVGTVVLGALTALGTAWQVVKADRDDIRADIAQLEKKDAENDLRTAAITGRIDTEQAVLAEIRTQLAQLNARVAEVQVTLMQARR